MKTPVDDFNLSYSFLRNAAILAINKLTSWRVRIPAVDTSKPYVILSYPHTSNWDTFIGLIALTAGGVKPAIVVKDSWNVPVLGPILKNLGVIFIDRDKIDFIAMKKEIRTSGRSVVLAIEGTRKKVDKVKKGFYFLARDLELDIVPSVVNYKDEELQLLPAISIMRKDGKPKKIKTVLAEVRKAYEPYAGTSKYPDQESPIV